MAIRILYIGEIVGKAGVFALRKLLPALRRDMGIHFTVACANGATGGAGLGKAHSVYLRKLGVEVLTLGEAAFYKKDIVEAMPSSPWVLRPANHPPGVPGRGFRVYKAGPTAVPVAVIQLLGQAGFGRIHLDNPFLTLDAALERVSAEARVVLLDFRATTTAEKVAMARYADGRVSAVIGSHARALTADARVSPAGTAAITDTGRTGSLDSVGGMDAAARIGEYLSGIPAWAGDAAGRLELQGCVIDVGEDGKATAIQAIRVPCKEAFHERTGSDS